jgi:FKBP-type peptidyl-prolyl cis-trans isomerase (trigger factor)
LNSFICELEIISRPKFDLVKYKEFEVVEPHISKTSEEVIEEYLENIRQQHCDTIPYSDDDFVTMEDQITFSYTGTCNGIVLPEYTSEEGVFYKVGEEKFVGFDSNLIGMKSGEERSFTLVLDGKNIDFNVNMFMGVKKFPRELTDDFLKSINIENMNVLMTKLTAVANQLLETEKIQKLTEAVTNHLIASNPIEIPEFIITAEAKYAATFYKTDLSKLPEDVIKQLYVQSDRNLRISFILDAIRNIEPDAVLNDNEAIEKIKQFSISRGQNPDDILKSPALPQLISTIKDEFVVQWVLTNSTIIPQ